MKLEVSDFASTIRTCHCGQGIGHHLRSGLELRHKSFSATEVLLKKGKDVIFYMLLQSYLPMYLWKFSEDKFHQDNIIKP